jgi:hypothetical protein
VLRCDCGIPDNTGVSDTVHLLIPFASSIAEGCAHAQRALQLPQLEKILARLAPAGTDEADEFALSMPHERVLAQECGLPCDDGRIPWAAWELKQAGGEPGERAWAHITPCHWTVGADHIDMSPPQDLNLDAGHSRTLLAAMQPFFEQDGIALEYGTPTSWFAHGELFRDLATPSLDRVVGHSIDDWLPRAPEAKVLRRLQQEMQMLLYTHPVNDERTGGAALPVNSFWASGTGALPAGTPAAQPSGLRVAQGLRDAALRQDWHAWSAAWRQLDSTECAALLKAMDGGQSVMLTLCGERNARSWSSPPGGALLRRLGGLWAGKKALAMLESL